MNQISPTVTERSDTGETTISKKEIILIQNSIHITDNGETASLAVNTDVVSYNKYTESYSKLFNFKVYSVYYSYQVSQF